MKQSDISSFGKISEAISKGKKVWILPIYFRQADGSIKRRREQFPEKSLAARRKEELTSSVNLNGATATNNLLDPQKVKEYLAATALLPEGITLIDAVRGYITGEFHIDAGITIGEVIEEFWDHETSLGLSGSHYNSQRPVLNKIISVFGDEPVSKNLWKEYEDWFKELEKDHAWGYVSKFSAALSKFYKYAIKHGYTSNNPIANVTRTREPVKENKFLSPELMTAILHNAEENDPALIPYLVLGAFAGIRPEELRGNRFKSGGSLSFDQVDFKKRTIFIGEDVAKRGGGQVHRRFLENLPDNVWEWLEKYHQYGFPTHASTRRRITRIWEDLDISKVDYPVRSIFRKSFATYSSIDAGVDTTVEHMGHNGSSTLRKHYRGYSISEEAEKWFSIRPK